MKIALSLKTTVAALSLLYACGGAYAGIVFTMEDTGAEGGSPQSTQMMAQDGNVKILVSSPEEGASAQTMIFDESAGEMMMIDPDQRTYTVIDQEALNKIASSMRQMREQMDAMMAQIPPEQREKMKSMMGSRMPGMNMEESPEVEVKATGESKTVGEYATKAYDVVVDGKRQVRLWVTDWDNVKGSREAQESMRAMGEFFSKMFESVPGMGKAAEQNAWINAMSELEGFPVQTVQFDGSGKELSTSTLKDVETRDIEASEFEPPAGYKRQDLGM